MACDVSCPGIERAGPEGFSLLAAEWGGLLQRSYDNRIYYTQEFLETWWTIGGSGEAVFITRRADDGTLSGILPLQLRHESGCTVLSLLGDPEVADYMDALAVKVDSSDILSSLWRYALRELRYDQVELRHVPSTSPLLPALSRVATELGLKVEPESDEVCPVAILCSAWDGYLDMLSKKNRHEIRRKLRRAQENVTWSWHVAASPEELTCALDAFFQLHEKSAAAKAHFMTPSMRRFFETLSYRFLERGWLRLGVFTRGGAPAAANLAFRYRNRYLLYNSGYDPALRSVSPGIVAVVLSMQDAIADGAVAFDFLSGVEPYKYQLGASNTYTSRVSFNR